ncbi:hypothetical protein [Mucilaginibacter psychrotolerans]|uniref:Uncharacterized protein n=1 Tax=Mucilaginibacter psychrotolerans TaxID=1524096 RepID=A0A4Y8SF67_9SPHI|nr:hypothetical protein [Mucilaginibacter psychrotolerans]TFF37275.1 hypothetical protein E2R66_12625 [Mucilaginibacter psychrotolerans]
MTNKKSSLKNVDKEENVNNALIIHILEKKLGYKIPKSLLEYDGISLIRAKILIQYYLKKEYRSYYDKNISYYEVYDENNDVIIKENLYRKEKERSINVDVSKNGTGGEKFLSKEANRKSPDTSYKNQYKFAKF